MDPQQQASQPAEQTQGAASEQAADQPQETESGWFRRTIDRLTGRSGADTADAASEGQDGAAEETTPKVVTLTEEELAERERRAHQSGRDRARYELTQPRPKTRAEQRAEELKQLDDDPWQAAERRKQEIEAEEALERSRESLFGVVQVADKAMLDPVLTRLPESEWKALLAEDPDSLTSFEGRSVLVTKALERIEANALEKAKQHLRTNKAFRKELLAELRGGMPEPELTQPGARSSGANGHVSENGFMNSALRRAARSAQAVADRDQTDDLDDDT